MATPSRSLTRLLYVGLLLFIPVLALAGPNEGGTLILHANPSIVFTSDTADYCGMAGLDSCSAAVTSVAWDPGKKIVFHVLAAFPPESSPRLKALSFGIDYDPTKFMMAARSTCADFELSDGTWPAAGTGTSQSWTTGAQIGLLTEVYWFAGYAYSEQDAEDSTSVSLIPHPLQHGVFVDDAFPAEVDTIAGYGRLGFGTNGSLACPGGGGDSSDSESDEGSPDGAEGGEDPEPPPEGGQGDSAPPTCFRTDLTQLVFVQLNTTTSSQFVTAVKELRREYGLHVLLALYPDGMFCRGYVEQLNAIREDPWVDQVASETIPGVPPLGYTLSPGAAVNTAQVWNYVCGCPPRERTDGAYLQSCVSHPDTSGTESRGAIPSGYEKQTSSYMMGDVGVKLIFPESAATSECEPVNRIENWRWTATAEIPIAVGEIAQSLIFLADYSLDSDLTFFIPENYSVTPTVTEPIQGAHDSELWGQEALYWLGYGNGNLAERCYAFCNDKRREFATNWYYIAFTIRDVCDVDNLFADSDANDSWFAFVDYLHAPYLVQTYENDGWSTSNMDMVFRHESCHVFGADDEYAASDCDDHCGEPFGYLHVPNENCIGCPAPPAHVDCLMSEANEQYCDCLCPYTMGQIGWRDANGDGAYDPINHFGLNRKAVLGTSGYTFSPGDWIYMQAVNGAFVKTIALSDWNCPPPYGRFPWDGIDYKGDDCAIGQYYYRRNNQGNMQAVNLGSDSTPPEICDLTVAAASEYPGPHLLSYRFRDPNVGTGLARARVRSSDIPTPEHIPVVFDRYTNGSCLAGNPIIEQHFYLPRSGGWDLDFTCWDGSGHSASSSLHFATSPVSGVSPGSVYVPGLRLRPGVPNPARAAVTWEIQGDFGGGVDLLVVGVDGRVVREWQERQVPPGRTSVVWDGQDQSGMNVPAGKYFLRARTAHGSTVLGEAVVVH